MDPHPPPHLRKLQEMELRKEKKEKRNKKKIMADEEGEHEFER